MKRKLKLNRETLRNLEDQDLLEAEGGTASTVFTRCGSCQVSCGSCVVSSGGTCQITCFVC